MTKIVEGGTSLSVNADNNVQKMIDEKELLKKDLAAKIEAFAEADAAKSDLLQEKHQLEMKLLNKDSELKTLKQEVEQNHIKLKQMERTMEDEKSKANALKQSEDKLNSDIEALKKKQANLQSEHDDLKETKMQLDENMSKLENKLQVTHSQNRTQE